MFLKDIVAAPHNKKWKNPSKTATYVTVFVYYLRKSRLSAALQHIKIFYEVDRSSYMEHKHPAIIGMAIGIGMMSAMAIM